MRPITDRQKEVLLAVIRSGGSFADAGERLGCTGANVAGIVGSLANARGLARVRTWPAQAALAEKILAEGAPPPQLPAKCHPEREEFQVGLCRECYRVRVERSKAAPIRRRSPHEQREHEAIQKQLRGEDGRAGRSLGGSRSGHPGDPLSPTHFAVLYRMASGETMHEAAASLEISEQTVKNHLSEIYHRLDVRGLVAAYGLLGWLKAPGDVRSEIDLHAALSAVEQAASALEVAARSLRRAIEGAA